MSSMDPTDRAEFAQGKFVRSGLLIFARGVVFLLALFAGQRNKIAHWSLPPSSITENFSLEDFGDDPGAHRPPPLPDRKP